MTLTTWYQSPTAVQDLAKLLSDGVLHDALLILQERARVRNIKNTDPVILCQQLRRLEGYQEALDDLRSLATIPEPKAQKLLPEPWAHAKSA